jgi:hypothetical protein
VSDIASPPAPVTDENPFRRAFWVGVVDARVPALLRVALGVLVATDLGDRLRDFHAFYTADGMIPAAGEAARRLAQWSLFNIPWLSQSRGATLALFLAGFPLALAFALGYRTRLVGALLWAFVLSLQVRNLHVCDGGDAVLCALLFWSMFTDMGAAFSLDVRLGRRRAQAWVPAAGVRFLQLQVALIYLVTFFAKSGPTWHDGTAVYRALMNSDWQRGLAPWVAAHPSLCKALTYATLAIEGAFPLLVMSPWRPQLTRAIAVCAGLALHLGIFFTMRIGIFCQVMPASYLVFLSGPAIDRVQAALGVRISPTATAPFGPAGTPRWRLTEARVIALLAVPMALILTDQIFRASGRLTPRPVLGALMGIGQHQNWRMFAPDAPLADVTWRVPGRLADGRTVELTDTVVPKLRAHRGFLYSRWHRLRNSLIVGSRDLLLPFGRYVCRRANAGVTGAGALASFELIATLRPTLEPGPAHDEVILRQPCGVAPAP